MKYLLDTCVISEMVKPRPNKGVVQWLSERGEETLFLSVLTIGEIQKGIAKLVDGKRKESIQTWLDEDLRLRFSERILAVDEDVASTWGIIQGNAERGGRSIPTIDGLLGATAIAHNLSVVTRNEDDIGMTGARIVNPWNQ
ncbi:MAG: type II toxin-antitoxin system VapC family toxin [Candidatus Hydrogenedentes bacterium]|nr:type II toxin-antitoxin system VapC family toxin [Candidatus Hydrogenedentota bacterium]